MGSGLFYAEVKVGPFGQVLRIPLTSRNTALLQNPATT